MGGSHPPDVHVVAVSEKVIGMTLTKVQQSKALATIYLLVIPAIIIFLLVVSLDSLSANHEQDRRQQLQLHRNCVRIQAVYNFLGILVATSAKPSVRRQRALAYIRLVEEYNGLGDCPPLQGGGK